MQNAEKQHRSFRSLICLFGAFSALLIWGGWYASGIAPHLVSRNYQSIQFASEMQSALIGVFLDAANGSEPKPGDLTRFSENLEKARGNITEPTEPEIVKRIATRWDELRAHPVTPTVDSFQHVAGALGELTSVNEKAMLAYEDTAESLRYTFLLGGVMGMFLFLVYSIQIALLSEQE